MTFFDIDIHPKNRNNQTIFDVVEKVKDIDLKQEMTDVIIYSSHIVKEQFPNRQYADNRQKLPAFPPYCVPFYIVIFTQFPALF
ncbi:MAG: hypothetical protein ACI4RJ_04510 [Alphaproteobacteria bacterium]